MKLIRRIERVEGLAKPTIEVGFVWTKQEKLLDPARGAGGRVVADIYDDPEDGARTVSVEREAEGPDDEGRVYDRAGELVGLVLAREGSLLTLEYFPLGNGPKPLKALSAGS